MKKAESLMRWLFALVIMGAAVLPALAENVPLSPTFTKLGDALTFIDHGLDKEDWNGLTQALYPPFQANAPN